VSRNLVKMAWRTDRYPAESGGSSDRSGERSVVGSLDFLAERSAVGSHLPTNVAQPFGGGAAGVEALGLTVNPNEPSLPGMSKTYGVLNYTMFALNKWDFITVRNEWWKDERGMRSGEPGTYTSHTIGLTHNISQDIQVRPGIGYYRNWTEPAFDLGTKHGIWLYRLDYTVRF